jgi:hypothetical protein
VVHDALPAIQAQLGRRIARVLRAGAAVVCCVALLSGCGSTSSARTAAARNPAGASSHSSVDVGESARSDTCAQWEAGTATQRHGALARLRKFAGSPVGSSAGIQNGHVLSDQRAYKLFQSFCAKRYARAFKLYKLYERAAAFLGH